MRGTKCPWCKETFKSSTQKDPVSTTLRNHVEYDHVEETLQYAKICAIWKNKVLNEEHEETMKELLDHIIHIEKDPQRPNPNIVNDYTPEEFKELSKEEAKEIAENQ